MARPLSELQAILANLEGVDHAFIQHGDLTKVPANETYVIIERSGSQNFFADNILYWGKKRYTVTLVERAPDSLVPDRIEAFPATYDRRFVRNGQYHTAFQLYF